MTEKADIQSKPKKSDKKWKWQKEIEKARKEWRKIVKGEEERK